MPTKRISSPPHQNLPAALEARRRQAERALGRPVSIREVRIQDPGFRGRIKMTGERLIIEYQVAQSGYFWEAGLIERLLLLALKGETNLTLREDE